MENQEDIIIAKEQLSFLVAAFSSGLELGEKQSRGVSTIISHIEKCLPTDKPQPKKISHLA